MPPSGEPSHSALPRRTARLPARTPAPHRVSETPFGKIRPVFDGFDLAETSDWMEPPTPGPSHLTNITLRTPGRRRTRSVYPTLPELADSSVDESREHRSLLSVCQTARNPVQENDFYRRRITDSDRRISRSPLPTEVVPTPPALDVAPTPRSRSMSASQVSIRARTPDASLSRASPATFSAPQQVVQTSATPSSRSREASSTAHAQESIRSVSPGPSMPSPRHDLQQSQARPPTLRLPLAVHRTVVAIGSGGKTLTRAERARVAGGGSVQTASHNNGPVSSTPRPLMPTKRLPAAVPTLATTAEVSKPTTPSAEVARSVTTKRTSSTPALAPKPSSTTRSHETTPFASPRPHETPGHFGQSMRRYASPDLSVETLRGQPEDWDASMAVSVTGGDISRSSASASMRRLSTPRPVVNDVQQSEKPIETETPARPTTPASSASTVRRVSGGVLGFLSGLLGVSPAVGASEPEAEIENSRTPEQTEVKQQDVEQQEHIEQQQLDVERSPQNQQHVPVQQHIAEPHLSPKPRPQSSRSARVPFTTQATTMPAERKKTASGTRRPPREERRTRADEKIPPAKTGTRPTRPAPAPARPALGPARSVNLPAARPAPIQKRKAPPSPPHSSTTQHKRRVPPSPSKTSQPSRPPPPRTAPTSFTAQALARLPKPGQGHAATPSKTTIRDAERARDLAVRRAVFERMGVPQPPPAGEPTPPRQTRPRPTLPVNHIPGEASRRRAEERAAFNAQVAQRAAARAATQAEQERIRAEIEAEMDRQARRQTVIRARPLPAMYHRRE